MYRTWKNLKGKFFPQLEGLFLTQTRVAKSINFWEYVFELCKKFPQNIVNPVWPVVERVDR